MIVLSSRDVLGKKSGPQTIPLLLTSIAIAWAGVGGAVPVRSECFLQFSHPIFLCSVMEMVSWSPFKSREST